MVLMMPICLDKFVQDCGNWYHCQGAKGLPYNVVYGDGGVKHKLNEYQDQEDTYGDSTPHDKAINSILL